MKSSGRGGNSDMEASGSLCLKSERSAEEQGGGCVTEEGSGRHPERQHPAPFIE
jgi:hypothetical protein